MSDIAPQVTGVSTVYSIICSVQIKETSKLRVTGICEGNSLVTGEFPTQRASNAENASIWRCFHERLRREVWYVLDRYIAIHGVERVF